MRVTIPVYSPTVRENAALAILLWPLYLRIFKNVFLALLQDGCLRTRILNRFCYGQCNSFYIPKSQPELTNHDDEYAASSAQFRSCALCAPMTTDWTTVVLRCPKLLPPFRRRRVRVVRHCKCLAVRVRRWIRLEPPSAHSEVKRLLEVGSSSVPPLTICPPHPIAVCIFLSSIFLKSRFPSPF